MVRVLLINPPLLKSELYARGSEESASILPPLGLAYVAAVLKKEGHEVEVIDGIAEDIRLEEIGKRAIAFDIIGVESLTAFALRAHQTAAEIKKHSKVPVVMGGPHPTALPFEVINDKNVDFVVVGEGEYTFLELVNNFKSIDKIKEILGLVYEDDQKGAVFTGHRPLLKNLDELPYPGLHLFPMKKYKNSETRSAKQPALSIITSRGCTFGCTFCNKKIFGRVFRAHSAKRVVDEIEWLIQNFGARQISIWDETFTLNRKRVIEICNLLIERKLNIPWDCATRVDCIDYELLKKMKEAGCESISYGIESGSERIIESIKKGFTKSQVITALNATRKVGIEIRTYFVLGFVGETIKDMKQTINFAKKLKPDYATFTLLVPHPQTEEYEEAIKEGTFDDHYWKKIVLPEYNFLKNPVYVPKGLTASQLLKIHMKAYRSFYFSPYTILKQLTSIRNKDDLKRLYKGVMTIFKAQVKS
ncbi:B12-binding domain-containing radical SAM protein [Candidatus Pacearchaeota archaeon]|nr:B12-binding domain-containing radical SAM protein [Candidatus Pacearchaeota archaeon]